MPNWCLGMFLFIFYRPICTNTIVYFCHWNYFRWHNSIESLFVRCVQCLLIGTIALKSKWSNVQYWFGCFYLCVGQIDNQNTLSLHIGIYWQKKTLNCHSSILVRFSILPISLLCCAPSYLVNLLSLRRWCLFRLFPFAVWLIWHFKFVMSFLMSLDSCVELELWSSRSMLKLKHRYTHNTNGTEIQSQKTTSPV